MRILRERLEVGATRAEGVVVIVDVIRAFTTAAFALDAGATEIRLRASVAEALAEKAREPSAFLMGEEGGAPPPGFDHGNSPALLVASAASGRLRDRVVIQRTGMGTRCAVAASRAVAIFGASLVVASATARAVLALRPELVTLVESGGELEGDDAVCDYIEGLLNAVPVDHAPLLRRVRDCWAARQLTERGLPHSPAEDLQRCLDVDRFSFAIRAERTPDRGLVAFRDG
ncbi:MAG: 2-phosphosulfolactate phosphatase [Planctomycetota bacterium]